MSRVKSSLKPFPEHRTDEEAERFVAEADLSAYDFSGFSPVHFEFEKKDARMEVRLPVSQLEAIKLAAKAQGIPYTRLVRQFIERGMQGLQTPVRPDR